MKNVIKNKKTKKKYLPSIKNQQKSQQETQKFLLPLFLPEIGKKEQ
jgi:hypothetical protein